MSFWYFEIWTSWFAMSICSLSISWRACTMSFVPIFVTFSWLMSCTWLTLQSFKVSLIKFFPWISSSLKLYFSAAVGRVQFKMYFVYSYTQKEVWVQLREQITKQ
jgi:hypothetical protein